MSGAEAEVHGASALRERFGRWPSFHDAEVLGVRLDSGQRSDGIPALELDVHVFETTGDLDARGHFATRLHTLVTLRFVGVDEVELGGFGPQNVLGDLVVERDPDPGDEAPLLVELPSSHGLGGGFRCRRAAVVDVRPHEPGPHSVYGGA